MAMNRGIRVGLMSVMVAFAAGSAHAQKAPPPPPKKGQKVRPAPRKSPPLGRVITLKRGQKRVTAEDLKKAPTAAQYEAQRRTRQKTRPASPADRRLP